jgi:probable F420-dependent oxidoreductase
MKTRSRATKLGIHTLATDEQIHPAKLGLAVEERGFAALFLGEHSHIPVNRAMTHPLGTELPRETYRALDPFVTLGVVAAATENLLLGTAISLLVQRDPIHTAKEVASLDWVSNGRVIFGVGVGWIREEMRNHGTDPRIRGELLDERMAAIIEIWTKDEAEFHGKYVDFDPIFAWPKPVQQPHPPVYVGGESAKAVARATRFGGWIPGCVNDPARVAEQLALVGPEVPVIAYGAAPDPEIVAAYREGGVEWITFYLPGGPEAEVLHTLDELAALID